MSSVTERHQAAGDFTIDLKSDTPADIRRRLDLTEDNKVGMGFALLVVTDQHFDASDFSPADDPETTPHPLLQAARYAGVLTETANRRTQLAGQGLLSMLQGGDLDAGAWAEDLTDEVLDITPAADLIEFILEGGTLEDQNEDEVTLGPSPLRAGTIHADTTVTRIAGLQSILALLNDISTRRGRNYLVRPTGEVDWGTAAELYGSTPRCIVGVGLPAEDDARWVTVRVENADWAQTLAGYANGAIGEDTTDTDGVWLAPALVVGQYQSAIRPTVISRRTLIEPGNNDANIFAWADRVTDIIRDGPDPLARAQTSVQITGTISDGTRLEPGEQVLIWDPEIGIEGDDEDEILYAGEPIRPRSDRLNAVTWPVTEGMGVYLLYIDWTIFPVQRVLDLTDYVDFNQSAVATLELGLPPPSLEAVAPIRRFVKQST